MAASDGLKDHDAAARLLQHLLAFVDQPDGKTFDGLVDAVGSLPAPAEGYLSLGVRGLHTLANNRGRSRLSRCRITICSGRIAFPCRRQGSKGGRDW